jgi:hypothetical protein
MVYLQGRSVVLSVPKFLPTNSIFSVSPATILCFFFASPDDRCLYESNNVSSAGCVPGKVTIHREKSGDQLRRVKR